MQQESQTKKIFYSPTGTVTEFHCFRQIHSLSACIQSPQPLESL